MENKYAHRLETLIKKTKHRLHITHRMEFKKCFRAVAGYVNGHIFISCGKFGVALRLPPETLESLFKEKGIKHLKYFPNGHIKREYAVIPQRIIDDESRFKKLVHKSVKYADSMK